MSKTVINRREEFILEAKTYKQSHRGGDAHQGLGYQDPGLTAGGNMLQRKRNCGWTGYRPTRC